MKKAIFLFMTLLMCCAFLSCSKDDDPALMTIAVTAVTITEGETYAMTVGDTHTLFVLQYPLPMLPTRVLLGRVQHHQFFQSMPRMVSLKH